MAGSEALERCRAGLLADAHGIPVVAVREGRVHDANEAALGFFSNLHVGMDVGGLFEAECRKKLRDVLRAATSGVTVEMEVTRADLPPIVARVLVLASRDEQLLVVGERGIRYTEDTGAKLMAVNAELGNLTRQLSQRMHELSAAKDKARELGELRELFITALAHDLRTMLNAILLAESFLRDEPRLPGDRPWEQHVEIVERNAKRMLQLIDSLLFAAQLDAADSLPAQSVEIVRLDEVAREMAKDLTPLAEQTGVRIEVSGPEPVWLRGHRTWLGQVLSNLLGNAIRHSPEGEPVVVNVAVEGAGARCDVIDRGPGVPVAEREQIFERFVQRGERRGRMGIGLHICRRIIALHGGQIWVEDAPGGGARFSFRIPSSLVEPSHGLVSGGPGP